MPDASPEAAPQRGVGAFGAYGRRTTAARFAPRALALVPWLDALILVVAYALFANATALVPGQKVALPALPFEDGERPSSLAVAVNAVPRARSAARAAGPDTLAAVAFLGDESYDLSDPARVAAFRGDLAAEGARTRETRAVVYLDESMPHGDTLRLARVLRGAGVEKVLFAVRPRATGRRQPK